MRRGSTTSTLPSHQRGTPVDLPELVGEEITTGPWARLAVKRARSASIGSSGCKVCFLSTKRPPSIPRARAARSARALLALPPTPDLERFS
jgi:hypothetical protein